MSKLHEVSVLRGEQADVGIYRERQRLRLVRRLAILAWAAALWSAYAALTGRRFLPLPSISTQMASSLIIVILLGSVLLLPLLGAGRSPHVLYRPSEIDVGLDDVRGARVLKEEVVRTLNLFLASKTFEHDLGGRPRRAVLFEGPPGTGKTFMAKAMAREAGVPFLFVSSSAFQSMYYGQTNRKIRSYFRALRKFARQEGGAIGFIEELDAIGGARTGMGASTSREGITGVVNELLIQLQSFDEPPLGQRLTGWTVDRVNRLLPAAAQLRKPTAPPANILVVGATNRKDDLDPALLRPGRFDRSIHFDLPNRPERRDIIDYYLDRKAHDPELDVDSVRDRLAAKTGGYTPVMIEHLFDEALVWALRRGADALDGNDLEEARLVEMAGLRNPAEYTEEERLVVATHEAGHATLAFLAGRDDGEGAETSGRPVPVRQLEVLSIIKRGGALGLLGHSDTDEHFTRSKGEMISMIRVALAGMVAEQLAFGESSSGPADDLRVATEAAAGMVGAYGMGGSLVSFNAANKLGSENLTAKVLADEHGREALEAILDQARVDVENALRRHRGIWEALRDALLEREELVGDEILEVIQQAILRRELTELDLRD